MPWAMLSRPRASHERQALGMHWIPFGTRLHCGLEYRLGLYNLLGELEEFKHLLAQSEIA